MLNKEFKQISVFLILTILLSYFVFWGPIAYFKIPTVNLVDGKKGEVWAILLFIIGGFVPSIVGLVLTGIYDGRNGVKELFKSSFNFKLSLKWYTVILLIGLYFAVSLILIYTLLEGTFEFKQFLIQLPTIVPLIILGPLSEEYGWRGFAMKKWLKNGHPVTGSLIVGTTWAMWHLPLFYMLGSSQHESNLPFFVFFISVICISFIFTYIYIRTNYKLSSAILFHWIYTYVLQVVSTTVIRSKTYNLMECLPALLIGLYFVYKLKRNK